MTYSARSIRRVYVCASILVTDVHEGEAIGDAVARLKDENR